MGYGDMFNLDILEWNYLGEILGVLFILNFDCNEFVINYF